MMKGVYGESFYANPRRIPKHLLTRIFSILLCLAKHDSTCVVLREYKFCVFFLVVAVLIAKPKHSPVNIKMPKFFCPTCDAEQGDHAICFHQQLYERADRRPLENHGTAYPCRQGDLDLIWKHQHHNEDAEYITPAEATAELCDWLHDRSEPDALKRLQTGTSTRWGPDLIIKAFKDLDRAFFKGTLMGNVRVVWKGHEDWDRRSPGDDARGITMMVRHAQCTIFLNAGEVLCDGEVQDVYRGMWRTLLHEMCVSRKFHFSYPSTVLGEKKFQTMRGDS